MSMKLMTVSEVLEIQTNGSIFQTEILDHFYANAVRACGNPGLVKEAKRIHREAWSIIRNYSAGRASQQSGQDYIIYAIEQLNLPKNAAWEIHSSLTNWDYLQLN